MRWIASLQGTAVLIGAALLAGWAWIASIKSKAVDDYKSRVEIQEGKIDAKAQTARKRAATDVDRVLPKYFRD